MAGNANLLLCRFHSASAFPQAGHQSVPICRFRESERSTRVRLADTLRASQDARHKGPVSAHRPVNLGGFRIDLKPGFLADPEPLFDIYFLRS